MQGALQVEALLAGEETAVTSSGAVCRSCAGCWQQLEGPETGQTLSALGQGSGSGLVREVNFWPRVWREANGSPGPCFAIPQASFLVHNQRVGSLLLKLLHFFCKLEAFIAAAEGKGDEEWGLVFPALPQCPPSSPGVDKSPQGLSHYTLDVCAGQGELCRWHSWFHHLKAFAPLCLRLPLSCLLSPTCLLYLAPSHCPCCKASLCHSLTRPTLLKEVQTLPLPPNLFTCAPNRWPMEGIR